MRTQIFGEIVAACGLGHRLANWEKGGVGRFLAELLADAVEPLSDKKAEAIGAPEMALRH